MIISSAALSDIGRIRSGNEDSYLADREKGLFVVADGMGGCLAGEVASRMAVTLFQEDLAAGDPATLAPCGFTSRTAAQLARAVASANRGVHDASRSCAEWTGMGTTIAAAKLDGYRLTVVHAGDSRVYLVRGRSIIRLTEDHSYAQELQAGGTACSRSDRNPLRHILTRALGPGPQIEPDIAEIDLMGGDRLILCSDGLTTAVSDDEIHTVVSTGTDPEAVCKRLVEMANERGGEDNITVVSVFLADGSYMQRLIRWIRRHYA